MKINGAPFGRNSGCLSMVIFAIILLALSYSIAFSQVVHDYTAPPNSASTNTKRLDLNAEYTGINADKQNVDPELTCIAALTSAANKVPYYTGSGTCALADFSAAIRTVITTPSSANFRSWVSDEVGTGPMMFGIDAAMSDDISCSGNQVLRRNSGDTAWECATISVGGGDALVANPLSQFAATTSAQLAGVLSNETGSGLAVFGTSPNITTPTGIVKVDVGLGNVDNTSDVTKFQSIDTSVELRTLMTDELGTGVLVFLDTPADDKVPVGDSASATTWRTLPDSDGATQKLQYDQGTNTFSAGTDDDVPEAGDFGALALTGDVTSSGLATTVAADAVALTTDTTGNYLADIVAGNGIAATVSAGEGVSKNIAFDFATTLAGNPALNANECVFTTTGAGGGFLCEGSVADGFEGNYKFADVTGADATRIILTDATSAGGDLTGTYPSPTVAANAVALTTDTTGNYMSDIAAGTGIATTHTPAEGSTGTIALSYTDKGADPAMNADECEFTGDATTNGEIVCEGDTSNAFETRIVVTDPTADRAMTIPNADSVAIQPLTCSSGQVVTAVSSLGVVTCANPVDSFCVAASDETTAITTGTAKVTFRMPYAFTLTNIRGSLNTVSSSGSPIIDVNEAGTTLMTTNKVLIDVSEKTSVTAVTAVTLTDTSLADDAEMSIDVDTAGTGAKGLKICLIGSRT